MKPLFLEFSGVNSFSDKATVDFRRLLAGGIFGIFGDTGAGKSTILDCIGFALYGRINRIGREGSSIADVVNYNCDKAKVNFEFETEQGGERFVWRVERTLNRNRGVQKAVLYEQKEGGFVALCDGAAQVNRKIETEIIGISFEDFKKCIALPQGEFSQFLQSSRRERLQLVAKLFSLERYGYPFYKRTDDLLKEKDKTLAGVKGKLDLYADVTPERLAQEQKTAEELCKEREQKRAAWQTAKAEADRYAEALKNVQSLAEVRRSLSRLAVREEAMTEKRGALDALRTAAVILSLQKDIAQAHKNAEISRTKANGLKMQAEEAEQRLEARKASFAALRTEETEAKLQQNLALAERAEKDFAELREAETKLKAARAEYRDLAAVLKKFADFDYEAEREKLAAARAALPAEDNLPDYIANRFKSLLLAEEYAAFAEELSALAKKYPVILPDATPLIDRYAARGVKNAVDLEKESDYFRACAKEKEKISQALVALEKRNTDFIRAKEKESASRKEGERLKADFDARQSALADIAALGKKEDISRRIGALQSERAREEKAQEECRNRILSLKSGLAAEEAKQNAYTQSVKANAEQIEKLLRQSGLSSVEAAADLLARYGDPEKLKGETEEYFRELHALRGEEKRLAASVEKLSPSAEESAAKRRAEEEAQTAFSSVDRASALADANAKETADRLAAKQALESEFAAQLKDYGLLEQIRSLAEKDKFMEFIAVEYLQEIAAGANNLLLHLTNGRYFLVYDKNFEVGDNFNGGEKRGVHTLSGGETFLVSLSLALALSAVIHQKSLRPIEFFFLDEGFGTLDDELVDTVMDSLEKLKNDNFSIGIISHVGELKNRLENRITVIKADGEHGSSIRNG